MIRLSVVHNELFGLLGVESQVVVGAPHCYMLDFLPVGLLIVFAVSPANLTMVFEPCAGVQS